MSMQMTLCAITGNDEQTQKGSRLMHNDVNTMHLKQIAKYKHPSGIIIVVGKVQIMKK